MDRKGKTVINISETMLVQTSDHDMMRKLDGYTEMSGLWKLVEIGKIKGEIIYKTYKAPKDLFALESGRGSEDHNFVPELSRYNFVPELSR